MKINVEATKRGKRLGNCAYGEVIKITTIKGLEDRILIITYIPSWARKDEAYNLALLDPVTGTLYGATFDDLAIVMDAELVVKGEQK